MRTPRNDKDAAPPSLNAADAPPGAERIDRRGHRPAPPERRCILTGERAPAHALIRLAISPDGGVFPDVLARAPGRGAWLAVGRAALAAAVANGKLRGALARSLKGAATNIPADLPDRIAAELQRAALARLGLEMRAGTLITGMERIEQAARRGTVAALFHASDAGTDGCRALAQAWRVGEDDEGSARAGITLPVDRLVLSVALGRENAVHIAVIDQRAAARVRELCNRWQFFSGWDTAPLSQMTGKDDAPG